MANYPEQLQLASPFMVVKRAIEEQFAAKFPDAELRICTPAEVGATREYQNIYAMEIFATKDERPIYMALTHEALRDPDYAIRSTIEDFERQYT